jgi:group I intron endonuclease
MTEPSICGVYRITHNIACGLSYVGSSININSRMRSHRNQLRRGNHHCKALQSAWAAYGEHAFALEILELINDEAVLADRERYWTNVYRDQVGGGLNRVTAGRHVTPPGMRAA